MARGTELPGRIDSELAKRRCDRERGYRSRGGRRWDHRTRGEPDRPDYRHRRLLCSLAAGASLGESALQCFYRIMEVMRVFADLAAQLHRAELWVPWLESGLRVLMI